MRQWFVILPSSRGTHRMDSFVILSARNFPGSAAATKLLLRFSFVVQQMQFSKEKKEKVNCFIFIFWQERQFFVCLVWWLIHYFSFPCSALSKPSSVPASTNRFKQVSKQVSKQPLHSSHCIVATGLQSLKRQLLCQQQPTPSWTEVRQSSHPTAKLATERYRGRLPVKDLIPLLMAGRGWHSDVQFR